MAQLLMLSGNPKKRKSGKRRSAAQRAATARMLAARGVTPKRSGKRRKSASRSVARKSRRSGARRSYGNIFGAIKPMAINGAIGGAGAVGVDVIMGAAQNVLPASVTSRINSDGTTNWLYYATKGAVAVGVGVFGAKIVSPSLAAKAGEGALTVMAYEILRSAMPSGLTMGFVNPARTMQPNPALSGTGKILNFAGTGRILNTGARSPGATVAQRINGLARR